MTNNRTSLVGVVAIACGYAGILACVNHGGAQPPQPPPPAKHGKVVLCNSGTGPLTASITVTNRIANHAQPEQLAPHSKASDVCNAVNTAALVVGLETSYSSQHIQTGLDIYAPSEHNDAGQVMVNSLNVTLDVQDF